MIINWTQRSGKIILALIIIFIIGSLVFILFNVSDYKEFHEEKEINLKEKEAYVDDLILISENDRIKITLESSGPINLYIIKYSVV